MFLDWALLTRGHASLDLAVYLAMSLPIEERRRIERSIVAEHARAILTSGAPGGVGAVRWDDPWTDYRRGLLRRFLRMAGAAAALSEEALERWDAGSGVVVRCFTAATDHAVHELP